MENENIEDIDSTTDEEIITDDEPKELGLPEDPVEVEPQDEVTDDSQALKQKNQELYEQLKKAKGFVRDKEGKWVKKETLKVAPKETRVAEDVTRTELYSLVKANVPDEDVNEVVIYAKSHGLTVTDALKTPEVKAILKVKDDYRKTADATNTRNSRYGIKNISDEQILEDASEGRLASPEVMADILHKKRMANIKN